MGTSASARHGSPIHYNTALNEHDGTRRQDCRLSRLPFGSPVCLHDGARLCRGRSAQKAKLHYYGNDRLAPDFTLNDANGKPWKLSDQRGKTVVMNFWTVTCQPCVEEMPSFEQLALVAAERDDLEVVAVTTDKTWADVKSLFKPGSKLKVLFDPTKSVVREKYGTRLFPETWVIDPDGVIRVRVDGQRDWSSPVVLDMIQGLNH